MSAAKPQIFVIQDFRKKPVLFDLIFSAATEAGASVFKLDAMLTGASVVEAIQDATRNATLIIADVTNANANLMYEVGLSLAQNKPIILIADSSRSVPSSFSGFPIAIYDSSNPDEFAERLTKLIGKALKMPSGFVFQNVVAEKEKRQSVFISYSHNDSEYLDRLLVHLKPLEKDGLIDLWVDTKLRAGDRWKKEIEKALQKATVAVLLVSADFLASDFIINNELPPLLRDAEERGVRIIPVIVKPCRFSRDQNLKHFQSVNDPKDSLIRLSIGEQELIYDQVSSEIEQTLSKK